MEATPSHLQFGLWELSWDLSVSKPPPEIQRVLMAESEGRGLHIIRGTANPSGRLGFALDQ